MLTKFEVTNFKNFNQKCLLDFTKTIGYAFNKECVVNTALIYGSNAIEKSNLARIIHKYCRTLACPFVLNESFANRPYAWLRYS